MNKRKLSESYEAGASKTKRIKLDQTLDACSFASLPTEIISEHIFYYMGFTVWLDTLVLVCKQWQLAAQISTVHKQLRVGDDLKRSPSLIATYNVNALVLEPESMNMTTLVQFITASPKLNTVVLSQLRRVDGVAYNEWIPILNYEPYTPDVAFTNIKTLSIRDVGLLTLFPNVTYLKIESAWRAYRLPPDMQYPSVQEVEVSVGDYTCLGEIVKAFPNMKKIYVPALAEHYISKEIESYGKEYGVQIIYVDGSDDSTTLSYLDYFNAFGYTRLHYFIERDDTERVKDTLLKHTSRAYEKDLIKREPQFTFPTRSVTFFASPKKIIKEDISTNMLSTLIEEGHYNYWRALSANPWELIDHADKYMPIPPEALKTIVEMDEERWLEDRYIVQRLGEFIKTLATLKDRAGNTLLHLLAPSSPWEAIAFWDQLLEHSDITALNNEQENAATIAFQSQNWKRWHNLVELGTPIQCEKYAKNLDSTSSLLSWLLTKEIPLSFLNNFTDKQYIQMLFFELQNLKSKRKPLVFRELIQLGADPTLHNARGQSLLNILVEEPTDELMSIWYCLVAFELDLNEYDSTGRTPLVTAIQRGNIKKIDFLLRKGANPNICGVKLNGKKIYPVKMQQTVANGDVIMLLAEHGADFTLEDKNGNTILNAAIAKHKSVDIKTLATLVPIDKPDKHNMTPLAKSICIADLTKVQACLASAADVNRISGPLMQSPLLLALEGSDQLKVQSIVQCLLETQKVDVTLRDKAGRSFVNYLLRTEPLLEPSSEIIVVMKEYATPQNIAFVKNEVEAILNNPHMSLFVTKLLKYATVNIQFAQFYVTVLGIDTNIQDSNRDTMLSLIEFHPLKSPPVIDFLGSHGANINHQNKQKNTPLMKAMDIITVKSSGHVNELLRHGASVELKNIWGLSPIDIDPTIRTIK